MIEEMGERETLDCFDSHNRMIIEMMKQTGWLAQGVAHTGLLTLKE